ncbi:MAG: acyl carrier protein [bacterium]|jgi:acyl carrier protein|nr:acyl carrier protein [bacterium]
MANSDIRERVVNIVVDQLGVKKESVTDDASFTGTLGADSLDVVEMVMAFESDFGVEIPDDDQDKITTVGEAIEYLESKVN